MHRGRARALPFVDKVQFVNLAAPTSDSDAILPLSGFLASPIAVANNPADKNTISTLRVCAENTTRIDPPPVCNDDGQRSNHVRQSWSEDERRHSTDERSLSSPPAGNAGSISLAKRASNQSSIRTSKSHVERPGKRRREKRTRKTTLPGLGGLTKGSATASANVSAGAGSLSVQKGYSEEDVDFDIEEACWLSVC
ncbi:unnamed protein product [Cyclocybe aegerita]|uniref:Uncharacterized protein n=1 Tax=Cyclocybe aegerita TaxID=1973307 RepID=A0A8S0VXE1_CYCAE|nr:unnamed protein product [Cyclocybe aegerita]